MPFPVEYKIPLGLIGLTGFGSFITFDLNEQTYLK